MKNNLLRLSQAAAAITIAGLVTPLVMTAADNPTPPAGAPAAVPAAPAAAPAVPPAAPPATAQPGGQGGGRGARGGGGAGGMRGGGMNFQGGGGMAGMAGLFGMNLDEQQRLLLREAIQKNREAFASLDEKLRAAQRELMQATIGENPDEKVIREKAETVAKIQTEIILLRSQALTALAPTLKPEQRDELLNGRTMSMLLTTSSIDFTGGRAGNMADPMAGGRNQRGGGRGGGGFGGGGFGAGGPNDPTGGAIGGDQPRRQRTNP